MINTKISFLDYIKLPWISKDGCYAVKDLFFILYVCGPTGDLVYLFRRNSTFNPLTKYNIISPYLLCSTDIFNPQMGF